MDAEKTKIDNTFIRDDKPEEDSAENTAVPCCSFCNVEMSQTRTKFRIDGWERSNQKLTGDDSGKLGKEILPVIFNLCPKCGKIDFRSDEKLNKN